MISGQCTREVVELHITDAGETYTKSCSGPFRIGVEEAEELGCMVKGHSKKSENGVVVEKIAVGEILEGMD